MNKNTDLSQGARNQIRPMIENIYIVVLILLSSIALVVWISIYIAVSIGIDQLKIGLLNVASSIVMAAVTILYVLLTYRILSQSKDEQKIAFIQKQLESFYYPLWDELNKILFEKDEGFLKAAEMNGHILDNDTKNRLYNTTIYDQEEFKKIVGNLKFLMRYRYLATKKIRNDFYNFTKELEKHVNEYQGIVQQEGSIFDKRNALSEGIKQEIEELEGNLAGLTEN